VTFRKGLVSVAVAMLAFAGVARADDSGSTGGGGGDQITTPDQNPPPEQNPGENPAETPATPAANPVAGRAPLMNLLDRAHVAGFLDSLGIDIRGYVEVGYLYDLTTPTNNSPPKTAPANFIFFPGAYKNSFMLNQLDLTLERVADASKGNFDWGFKFSTYYGRDAFYTHSNGILDQDNKHGGTNDQIDQLDIPEAYLTAALPVAGGLNVNFGKFTDPLGVEQINPTENLFYTHSYAFSYGMPFTLTGVISSLKLTNDINSDQYTNIILGISRGWNQSYYDNNGDPDGIVGVTGHLTGIDWKLQMIVGPEGVLPYGPPDDHDLWVLPDANVTIKANDQLSFTGDAFLGNAQNLSTWDGVSGYVSYILGKHVTLNGRAEYYHDGHGVTTGVGGGGVDYYELTAGAAITPMPNSEWLSTLTFRPEFRYDWASRSVFDATHSNQLTFAIDAFWKF
jgi:hypothetical protein